MRMFSLAIVPSHPCTVTLERFFNLFSTEPKKREGEERVDFSVSRTLLRGEKAANGVGVVLQTLRVNPHQFETVYRAVLDGSPEFQYVVDVTMIDVP